MLLTLWCRYALKVTVVNAYSCYIVCMIIVVWLSWSMSATWHWFPRVHDTHQHVEMHHVHRRETLLVCHNAPNVKFCRIFTIQMGHLCCHILIAKAWWDSILCAMTHLRRNAVGFSTWKFGNNSKCASKALIKTTPLPKSNW